MLKAEKGFQRIQGYREMHLLIEALNRHPPTEEQKQKSCIGEKMPADWRGLPAHVGDHADKEK